MRPLLPQWDGRVWLSRRRVGAPEESQGSARQRPEKGGDEMSAGICTFHRVLYLGSAFPACGAQNLRGVGVTVPSGVLDRSDALSQTSEERCVFVRIPDHDQL